MEVRFTESGLNDLQWWYERGQRSGGKKVWSLIHDIQRNGYHCTGQPEPLKDDEAGWYSVHIDKKNRMVFRIEADTLIIKACLSHYDDK